MRTTIDLPDSFYRALKARAALEGLPMKDLVRRLVERGLAGVPEGGAVPQRSACPSLSLGQPLPGGLLSNAGLFDLLDGQG